VIRRVERDDFWGEAKLGRGPPRRVPRYRPDVRYEGDIYRPPSEADALILQATVGCSWNRCTYCAMYREKSFRIRETSEILEDLWIAGRTAGSRVEKLFVADGDALVMDMALWEVILTEARRVFPRLRRTSAYATARNILEKTPLELRRLAELGLRLLYVGPESGHDVTLRRIAKGATFEQHVEAARKCREAGLDLSVIFLLGAGGAEDSDAHARASAALAGAMDPRFLSALTLTLLPGTPIEKLVATGRFRLPDPNGLLRELRCFVDLARPSDALFRTNHASNYLPLAGRLPKDRERLLAVLDAAILGRIPLREEEWRGL
jgi:radical SAM superfamily enzyme YgiQ (UPF0313 family)